MQWLLKRLKLGEETARVMLSFSAGAAPDLPDNAGSGETFQDRIDHHPSTVLPSPGGTDNLDPAYNRRLSREHRHYLFDQLQRGIIGKSRLHLRSPGKPAEATGRPGHSPASWSF